MQHAGGLRFAAVEMFNFKRDCKWSLPSTRFLFYEVQTRFYSWDLSGDFKSWNFRLGSEDLRLEISLKLGPLNLQVNVVTFKQWHLYSLAVHTQFYRAMLCIARTMLTREILEGSGSMTYKVKLKVTVSVFRRSSEQQKTLTDRFNSDNANPMDLFICELDCGKTLKILS